MVLRLEHLMLQTIVLLVSIAIQFSVTYKKTSFLDPLEK